MCGISVYFHKEKITTKVYKEFCDSLQIINHRGPDDEGIILINTLTGNYKVSKSFIENIELENGNWVENYNLILGHKRLSILELSAKGHQPMKGSDGSWIVFNGEIYNYIEIREELKSIGCIFNSNSDTEVILEAYRMWGKNCLNKFNGMWSIIIWDNRNKDIFISNDRFGVKPLFFSEYNNCFILTSELKQFKPFFNSVINNKHVQEFIQFGYLDIDENTIYQNIFRFKKGHYIKINSKNYLSKDIGNKQIIYYKINKSEIKISEKDAIEKFKYILNDSVKIRMRADVNFGFALSGGLDSSSILYSARNILNKNNSLQKLLGFSAIFPNYKDIDESNFIKIVEFDLPCKTYYCNSMDEFNFETFENQIYYQDEPLPGTSFLAEWSIYKKAKDVGIKILFNGQGADEVFAGYHHHFYKYCRQLLVKGNLPKYFSLVNQYSIIKNISKSKIHKIVLNELKLVSKMKLGIKKFDHILLKYWNEIDNLDEMLLMDFDTFQLPLYLRADDRDSMAFSIESRHPFMDYRIVEFGYSLPNNLIIKNGWQKYIIRKSMTEMPDSIRYRKDKKGFVTPQDIWLKLHKNGFEKYLNYNLKVFGIKEPSNNPFYNYALGCWLKVNKII